jgi:phenylalanine-4-hydroxylase
MQSNEVIDKLPRHLMGLIIDQPYNLYTSRDHAVWRYVMRQNVRFLGRYAHGSYTDGLKKTGISIETIPHMYGMNRILKEIGWAAVAVDGFIPPSAFMEFQAYNVLVIAADIRPADQIAYTPAPDIIHEAAGHAPIIADSDYAAYLKFFGEIGAKAFSSARDYQLYEAIRHLSILKADPYSIEADVAEAEHHLKHLDENMGMPSEMARIRNLHWWTVEYGLIGDVNDFKIYGAGLLSSIGESMNCIKPAVKKLPYSIAAADFGFDITTQQPQLFVTPDFQHLNDVLNQFADGMALRTGALNALVKAEDSENTATLELNSGLQISGTFKNSLIKSGKVIYLRTEGPASLCFKNKELPGHDKSYHANGFGSPLGRLADGRKLSQMSRGELESDGITTGARVELQFEDGVLVEGVVEYILNQEDRNLLLGLSDCTVKSGEETLFKPEWGLYDMAIGESITSGWPGPADPEAFGYHFEAPLERTHKIEYDAQALNLHFYYQLLRDAREKEDNTFDFQTYAEETIALFPQEWLLLTELYEYLKSRNAPQEFQTSIISQLEHLKETKPEFKGLIDDALALVEKQDLRA